MLKTESCSSCKHLLQFGRKLLIKTTKRHVQKNPLMKSSKSKTGRNLDFLLFGHNINCILVSVPNVDLFDLLSSFDFIRDCIRTKK